MSNEVNFFLAGSASTIIGSGLLFVFKEYVFPASLEQLKQLNMADAVYRKYRDPLILSASELCHRLLEIESLIEKGREITYLDHPLKDLRTLTGTRSNTTEDKHFRQYKLESTIFRLASFLGWLELYRQDLTFLDSGKAHLNERLDKAIQSFRASLADGTLNKADDWITWTDAVIYREEQRAIGEAMISGENHRRVIGYAEFCLRLESSPWLQSIEQVFIGVSVQKKDFRRTRIRLMLDALTSLIQTLDKKQLSEQLMARSQGNTTKVLISKAI
jgi:hypothetical protein